MPFVSSVRGTFGPQSENRGVTTGAAIAELLRQDPNSPGLPTGGTITTAGGYRIHTFLTSGTWSNVNLGAIVTAEYMVIGGGGAGGGRHGGGGGAGGMVVSTNASLPVAAYTITVGTAHGNNGINQTVSAQGNNSSIAGSGITTVTANGGGRGGTHTGTNPGSPGGSGGGGETSNSTVGSTTQSNQPLNGSGFGYPGGGGGSSSDRQTCGNGGGAGGAGVPTSGGVGRQSSITGTNYYWAGGGAGAWHTGNGPSSVGLGGLGGGGGGGGIGPSSPTNGGGSALNSGSPGDWRTNGGGGTGGNNTGGGGGGAAEAPTHGNSYPGGSGEGGSGASGIVVVRYLV